MGRGRKGVPRRDGARHARLARSDQETALRPDAPPRGPLVSIVVPSFNQGTYIGETIESCLAQDYRPIEIIVVDGSSTDGTVEVLRSFGDRSELAWISEPDGGVVDAVNKGLTRARGEILAIQSSDDLYLPGAVSAAVAALEANPEAVFAYGDVEYVDACGRPTGRTNLAPWSLRAYLAKELYVNQAAAFFRRAAARTVGLWDEEVAFAADADYWLRMGLLFPARKIDRLMARYRYHDAQRDKAGTRPAADWERAVRKRMADGSIARELRRPALRGIHLTWHHYTPERDWKRRTARLYRALVAAPSAVLHPGFPRRELLPGREPVWKLLSRTKQSLGTLLFDRPALAWPLLIPGMARRRWTIFRNRGETLTRNLGGRGLGCNWEWTSDLTVGRAFPSAARRLLRGALSEWPISFQAGFEETAGIDPDVTFIVGHRGAERLPLLRATVGSLLAQVGCSIEVLIVEQSRESLLVGHLPSGVRLVHQRPPDLAMPYSRAWAFNAGAKEARGRVLVFHDNDVLAPSGYAAEVLRLAETGYDALRLQRFVFYLDERSTATVVADGTTRGRLGGLQPELVRQNCEGHTIAVARDAYFRIGGHDESFLGWGGEDNEFFDRCRLLRFHPWGYLPFIHLWHAPQPGKLRPQDARAYLDETMKTPGEERALRLAALPFGSPEGPRVRRET